MSSSIRVAEVMKCYSPNKEMAHKVRSNLGSYLVLAAVFTTSHHNGRIQPFRNSRPTFWFQRISKCAPLHQDITQPQHQTSCVSCYNSQARLLLKRTITTNGIS